MTNSLHSNPARQRVTLEVSAAKRSGSGPRRRADRLGRATLQSLVMIALVCWGTVAAAEDEPSGEPKDALVIRLTHPERQATQLLKLFEGSRFAHPAAALAAWKTAAARGGEALGKPLEAVIAFFNPEMATEWRTMHQAELVVNWDQTHNRACWYAIVPRDDGTLAAGITASRLSEGGDEAPIDFMGQKIAVARLGRPGSLLAAQRRDAVVFGTTRDELLQAVERSVRREVRSVPDPVSGEPLESGLGFVLDVNRLPVGQSGPLPLRLAGELLRGLSCRGLHGTLSLSGGSLGLEVTTDLRTDLPAPSPFWIRSASIDRSWLELIPAAGAVAVISLAIEPSPTYWDSAFALADRLEKTVPDRAELAPLRTRLNLLTSASGARLEADLWPHLKGLTAGVFAAPGRQGRLSGAILALHLDSDEAALRLVSHTWPRLANLLAGEAKIIACWQRGHHAIVAWGRDAIAGARAAAADSKLSVAPFFADWTHAGKPAPARLGVFWPARLGLLATGPKANNSPGAWAALTDDPPAVWWGSNHGSAAVDSVRWAGLDGRVRRFLAAIPLEGPPAR